MAQRQRSIIAMLALALLLLAVLLISSAYDRGAVVRVGSQSLKNVDGPSSGAIATLQADVEKIQTPIALLDSSPADGLDGTRGSIAYALNEVERHLHGNERWVGAAAVPSGELHVADVISDTTTAFQVDAGNDAWSAWLQVVGSSDTPIQAGRAFFDPHRIMVVAVESANAVHLVEICYGASGDAAFAAGTCTQIVFQPQTVQGQQTILEVQSSRIAAGTKCWLRSWAVGQNTSTMDFFMGLHEYEG